MGLCLYHIDWPLFPRTLPRLSKRKDLTPEPPTGPKNKVFINLISLTSLFIAPAHLTFVLTSASAFALYSRLLQQIFHSFSLYQRAQLLHFHPKAFCSSNIIVLETLFTMHFLKLLTVLGLAALAAASPQDTQTTSEVSATSSATAVVVPQTSPPAPSSSVTICISSCECFLL